MANRTIEVEPKGLSPAVREQIDRARQREDDDRRVGLRAEWVGVEVEGRVVWVVLTNGVSIGFPFAMIPEIESAAPADVSYVSLSPSGSGLHWETLDVDVSVPGLLYDLFGKSAAAASLGAAGGSAKSKAKAAAARANGKRGGRPKMKRRKARLSRKPARKP